MSPARCSTPHMAGPTTATRAAWRPSPSASCELPLGGEQLLRLGRRRRDAEPLEQRGCVSECVVAGRAQRDAATALAQERKRVLEDVAVALPARRHPRE